MQHPFASIVATQDEISATRPGDGIVASPDVVMNRAFTLDAPPEAVWPWIAQLGKKRAGWYFSRSIERFIPPSRRAIRSIEPRWQQLAVGETVPDYGPDGYFEVATVEAPHTLVYTSQRGRISMSWSITLAAAGTGTRLRFRLVLGPVKRRWLANSIGDLFDAATIAGLAAGLRERLRES